MRKNQEWLPHDIDDNIEPFVGKICKLDLGHETNSSRIKLKRNIGVLHASRLTFTMLKIWCVFGGNKQVPNDLL
jgi:hypothetical protein